MSPPPQRILPATIGLVFLFQTIAAVTASPGSPAARRVAAKLDSLILPAVDFNETTLGECLEFLGQKMVDLDTSETDKSAKGVNFVDLRGGDRERPVTLQLSDVPAKEVLRYACTLAGCRYAIEGEAIVITDAESRRIPGGHGARRSDGSPKSRTVEKLLASTRVDVFDVDQATQADCLDFLKTKVAEARAGAKGVPPLNFAVVDPEVSAAVLDLRLRNASAAAALGYVMELSGSQYSIQAGIITIRKAPPPPKKPEKENP